MNQPGCKGGVPKRAVRRVVDDRRRNLAMTAICRRNAIVNARAPRIVEQDEVRRPLGDVELNEAHRTQVGADRDGTPAACEAMDQGRRQPAVVSKDVAASGGVDQSQTRAGQGVQAIQNAESVHRVP